MLVNKFKFNVNRPFSHSYLTIGESGSTSSGKHWGYFNGRKKQGQFRIPCVTSEDIEALTVILEGHGESWRFNEELAELTGSQESVPEGDGTAAVSSIVGPYGPNVDALTVSADTVCVPLPFDMTETDLEWTVVALGKDGATWKHITAYMSENVPTGTGYVDNVATASATALGTLFTVDTVNNRLCFINGNAYYALHVYKGVQIPDPYALNSFDFGDEDTVYSPMPLVTLEQFGVFSTPFTAKITFLDVETDVLDGAYVQYAVYSFVEIDPSFGT